MPWAILMKYFIPISTFACTCWLSREMQVIELQLLLRPQWCSQSTLMCHCQTWAGPVALCVIDHRSRSSCVWHQWLDVGVMIHTVDIQNTYCPPLGRPDSDPIEVLNRSYSPLRKRCITHRHSIWGFPGSFLIMTVMDWHHCFGTKPYLSRMFIMFTISSTKSIVWSHSSGFFFRSGSLIIACSDLDDGPREM